MNEGLKLVALYTRDLLEVTEDKIVFAETNEIKANNTDLLIAINFIGMATFSFLNKVFNPTTEKMKLSQNVKAKVSLNFYGLDAYAKAMDFNLLSQTQKGFEVKKTHGISLSVADGINDLKHLTGKNQTNRYEILINIAYNAIKEIDTLRIDQVNIEGINFENQEIINNG